MTQPSVADQGQIFGGAIEPGLFREAMARFASGVTIATTSDDDGTWWGFTASAFCALSSEPPLVLVCLANSANSHPVFTRSSRFIINVLGTEHEELALHFATKGINKFADGGFRPGVVDGLPLIDDALASLKCRTHKLYDGGDHTILVGAVEYVRLRREGQPALYFGRRFWDLAKRSSSR